MSEQAIAPISVPQAASATIMTKTPELAAKAAVPQATENLTATKTDPTIETGTKVNYYA